MYKNAIVLMIMAAVCFGRIQTITDTMRTKAIKLTNSGFDSILYIDADDSTLKNTGIYYNRVSQYTYFPTGIVIDTLNSEAAITVRSPNSTEYPSIPLKLYPASTNENVGHVIINPMLTDTFYNGSWLNRISTGGVSIGGQLYGEEYKNELIVGNDGFYFINRFLGDPDNPGYIKFETSASTGPNIYVGDTTGMTGSIGLYADYHNTRGARFGFTGTHIYDSLYLHGIKEDLTSDTVDILFMKYGYEVKKRSLADFADTIIKIIEATDTVYVDSARAAWKADTLIYLSDSLDVVRSLISAASDSVEKSHHSVYSDTADTAFVAGVADSAKNVSDTVAAHINGTLRYVAAFTDATHLGNSTMHFTSPSMGVLDYSSGSIQAMSIGLTATCAADSLYGSKSCFYFSPKLRHPDTVSSFDMVPVVDDSVVKVISSSTFRTQIGAQAAISGTDNYVAKYNGTGALQNSIIFDDDSKVGIGTATPNSLLSLGNSVDAIKMLLYDAGTNYKYGFGIQANEMRVFVPNDAHVSIGTISTADGSTFGEKVRINYDGNVGIGTDAPAVKLHVNGTIRSDDLTASMVVVTDASKNLVTGAVSHSELGFVNNTLVSFQPLTDALATDIFEVAIVSGGIIGGKFSYTIKAISAGSHAMALTGEVLFNAVYDGSIAANIAEESKYGIQHHSITALSLTKAADVQLPIKP